ncbi:hypothetical protein CU097_013202 [Rhizopus azygosporus]|uniref:Tc1-like transposase DDE domain-containing protein n=1 Tax=Rhizopus azygosporus TaxID=86630 RepID=A0A367K144_RHIAZ|nr:hypothetical protein CU097_013202 [Rhizopus azygosporus]
MRRTTAKLKKFPTRASAKFQAIHKKIKALRDVDAQYEVNFITTLGKYAKSASISLEKYKELGSENEEDDEEQEIDKQEHGGSEQAMHYLFNQLRVVAKNRILEEEPATEYVDDNNESSAQDSSESISKGTTTAHFIKFMNVLLDILNLNEYLKESYLVMDNCTIHKSKPMMRKIKSRGYKLMHLLPYSPELNLIEQFWAILKEN